MVVARVTYGDNSIVDLEQVYYLMQNTFAADTNLEDQVYFSDEQGRRRFSVDLLPPISTYNRR